MTTTTPSQPFRKCHLHVLRSLYASQGMNNTHQGEGQDNAEAEEHQLLVENDKKENSIHNNKNITLQNGTRNGTDDNDSDFPVDPKIWSLIERFLELRAQYRPHKERQLHWSKVYAESNKRLEFILSTTSSSIDNHDGQNLQSMLKPSSSLTPRTPLFATYGRSGSITPSLSLTPVSSNRNTATKSKINHNNRGGKLSSTLPAWNFIHQMLHQRFRQSMQSCASFRSQPFLTTLLEEAEMRCNLLKRILDCRNSTHRQHHLDYHGNPEGLALQVRAGKRRKLDQAPELQLATTTTTTTIAESTTTSPSSLGNFILSKYSNASFEIACNAATNSDEHEDSLTCTHMKFQLWAHLSSSVREVVDEEPAGVI